MALDYQKDEQATGVEEERVTKKGPQHTDPLTKGPTCGEGPPGDCHQLRTALTRGNSTINTSQNYTSDIRVETSPTSRLFLAARRQEQAAGRRGLYSNIRGVVLTRVDSAIASSECCAELVAVTGWSLPTGGSLCEWICVLRSFLGNAFFFDAGCLFVFLVIQRHFLTTEAVFPEQQLAAKVAERASSRMIAAVITVSRIKSPHQQIATMGQRLYGCA